MSEIFFTNNKCIYYLISNALFMSPYSVKLSLTAANIALFLLFACACVHSYAHFFYFNYRLVFGTLYPAYSSYKAIKNKDVKEYSRWMMYWVVFAMFSFIEVFADIFIAIWLPFYYEIKILFVLWLITPYGNGARIMYKNIVHPEFLKREHIIDRHISSAKEFGIATLWQLWRKGADVFNKFLWNLLHFGQTIAFHQMQNNYNRSVTSTETSPLLTAANFFPSHISGVEMPQQSLANITSMQLQNQQNFNERSNGPSLSPHRWVSEGALNCMESETDGGISLIGESMRSESDANLDDWEKMDAEDDNTKSPSKSSKIKVRRSKGLKKTESQGHLPPVKRATRAAAKKAREKCKRDQIDDYD